MKTLALLLAFLLFAFVLPLVDSSPQAVVSGPEACALCSQFPQYCSLCYLWLWVVALDTENWEYYLQ